MYLPTIVSRPQVKMFNKSALSVSGKKVDTYLKIVSQIHSLLVLQTAVGRRVILLGKEEVFLPTNLPISFLAMQLLVVAFLCTPQDLIYSYCPPIQSTE